MAASKAHVLYAVYLDTVAHAASPVLLDQVESLDYAGNLQIERLFSDGQVDSQWASVMGVDPMIPFVTTDIKTALDQAGIGGMAIDTDVDNDGVVFAYQKTAAGGTRAGASSHLELRMREGILIPRRLTASQGGIARITYEAIAQYDGTNDPITFTGSSSLSGTAATSVGWTVGKIVIGSTTIDSVISLDVDFGIRVSALKSDGEIYPTHVFIVDRTPIVTIQTHDVELHDTLGIAGSDVGASNAIFYLRKKAEGGGNVADGTAEHIKCTIYDDSIAHPDAVSFQGSDSGVLTIILTPSYDGTNDVLNFATASAIT